jgi:hypothetical protein
VIASTSAVRVEVFGIYTVFDEIFTGGAIYSNRTSGGNMVGRYRISYNGEYTSIGDISE